MPIRTYHTLCVWDHESKAWFDEFGSYSLAEVKEELQGKVYDGLSRADLKIIQSDGSAADMIAKRDALPARKG